MVSKEEAIYEDDGRPRCDEGEEAQQQKGKEERREAEVSKMMRTICWDPCGDAQHGREAKVGGLQAQGGGGGGRRRRRRKENRLEREMSSSYSYSSVLLVHCVSFE